ncbi:MAG: hypothetical protein WAO83_00680 [Fuerstiella sp.]
MANAVFRIKPKMMFMVTTALISAVFVGCGGPEDGRITVTGTVSIDGTPLPDGTVTFYKGSESSGVGKIDGGQFTVSQSGGSEGMQPGVYQVAVQSWEVEPFAVNESGEMGGPGKSRIPEKYHSSSTSELTAEISAEKSSVDFLLLSE